MIRVSLRTCLQRVVEAGKLRAMRVGAVTALSPAGLYSTGSEGPLVRRSGRAQAAEVSQGLDRPGTAGRRTRTTLWPICYPSPIPYGEMRFATLAHLDDNVHGG